MCEIVKSKTEKKLSNYQKDLPRFKVIVKYEQEFKNKYVKSLAKCFKDILKISKEF